MVFLQFRFLDNTMTNRYLDGYIWEPVSINVPTGTSYFSLTESDLRACFLTIIRLPDTSTATYGSQLVSAISTGFSDAPASFFPPLFTTTTWYPKYSNECEASQC